LLGEMQSSAPQTWRGDEGLGIVSPGPMPQVFLSYDSRDRSSVEALKENTGPSLYNQRSTCLNALARRIRFGELLAGLSNEPSFSKSFDLLLVSLSERISPGLVKKIKELISLDKGWDGENAQPVRGEALARALLLLRMLKQAHPGFVIPFIAPTFDGYVLLDWARPRRSLEVQTERLYTRKDFPLGGSVFRRKFVGWSLVGTQTSNSGKKEYFTAETDEQESDITRYYEWFQDDHLIWPTA
jgi:hypothetical protein